MKIIRDISWMSFNARVMQEAKDINNPLRERLRFLGIFSNNLDEFFKVRVASLRRMLSLNKSELADLEEDPHTTLDRIMKMVHLQNKEFNKTFSAIILELEKEHIFIRNEQQLTPAQKDFIIQYFDDSLRTKLVPLMLESIPEMPFLKDGVIYLACVLGSDSQPMMHRYSLIEVPQDLQRFVVLPSEGEKKCIILLEDIIRANFGRLFSIFGFNKFQSYLIKMTRDAEFDFDIDASPDFIKNIEKGVKNRKKGRATRFVYDKNIDKQLLDYLIKRIGLKNDNLMPGGRIHNFKDFMNFPTTVFAPIKNLSAPFEHQELVQPVRIMSVLEQKDILLSFPYHSFNPLIDFLREAAIDPNVTQIKITLYRLAKDSQIVNALINAARNGKAVTALIELRARFDEEANLIWKERLEEEGVKVILGIPKMKVHAKLCIIKRVAYEKTKYFGFISTGNFNELTASYYVDNCLLTSSRKILKDVERIFDYLEAPGPKNNSLKNCKVLLVAPINMRNEFLELINKEIKNHKEGKIAGITIKLNSLVDKTLIKKISEAAIEGVEVNLIIRGILCLNTVQERFKRAIKAISIVDEYLEHSRIIVFKNEGEEKVYISSADWMIRNLDHRIEVACPILDKGIKKEIIKMLDIQLIGNVKTRILDNEQSNEYVPRIKKEKEIRTQIETYKYLKKIAKKETNLENLI
ncbi:MAG TPA: polyphosphate kinase 1 [Edaphocola sp.]|nr:polyphosphate kinase 1 [Edaphocola sp.]